MVRVKDAGESASIEFGIGESFRNMDEMFETIEIGDQDRDPRTSHTIALLSFRNAYGSGVCGSLKRQKQKLKISKVKLFSWFQIMASPLPSKNGGD